MKWLGMLGALLACSVLAAEPAEVRFSDGSSAVGELSIMGARPLILRLPDSKIQRKFTLPDLAGITQLVETETMNRPWLYTEAGKAGKTYLEGEYPFVNFATEVELISGEKLRGHVISAVLLLRGEDGKRRKVFLNRQIRGKVGETLESLVYPVSVRFPQAVKAEAKPVSGRVAGYGRLEAATLLDVERGVVIHAKCDGENFTFPPLLPGCYEMYVRTDRAVLYGLNGTPVAPDELAGMRKVFPLADDFFRERWLLEANGGARHARALVYKRRGDYYAAGQHTPDGGYVWHLDIWNFHCDGETWKLDTRQIPVRYKQPGRDSVRKLFKIQRLGSVKPGDRVEINAAREGNDGAVFIRNLD